MVWYGVSCGFVLCVKFGLSLWWFFWGVVMRGLVVDLLYVFSGDMFCFWCLRFLIRGGDVPMFLLCCLCALFLCF